MELAWKMSFWNLGQAFNFFLTSVWIRESSHDSIELKLSFVNLKWKDYTLGMLVFSYTLAFLLWRCFVVFDWAMSFELWLKGSWGCYKVLQHQFPDLPHMGKK